MPGGRESFTYHRPVATVCAQRTIARPADAVWALVADVASIASWFPSFVSSRLDADGHRRIHLATGVELDEEILEVDPAARRLTYRIVGGLPILRSHHATVDVTGDADRAVVTYTTEVDPPALAWILGGAIEEALDELDRQLAGVAV